MTAQIDYEKVNAGIQNIEQALADNDMPAISQQLILVQQELQATPYLVDLLKPQDLGVLVKAERKRMTEDILAQTTPKKRKLNRKSLMDILASDPEDF